MNDVARPDRLTVAFMADTSEEAVALAKAWAAAEPGLRLRTICSVRRGEGQQWQVTLSVRWVA